MLRLKMYLQNVGYEKQLKGPPMLPPFNDKLYDEVIAEFPTRVEKIEINDITR
jgi:hypothetical protein